MGAGFWHPEPPVLDRLRQKILAFPEVFLDIVRAVDAKGMPLEPDEEAAKRLPRGFEAGERFGRGGVPEAPQPDHAAFAERG